MLSTRYIDLPPLAAIRGDVTLPGSKSISNRVLLLAGLCAGATAVHGLLESDDTAVMQGALRALGCRIHRDGDVTQLEGLGDTTLPAHADLFLGNSGTSVRSLAAVLAVLAATHGARYTVRGVARMHERPIRDLVDALRPLGCRIEYLGAEGFPPLQLGDGTVHALRLDAPIRVRGNVSSQFLTGLLQALCVTGAPDDVVVEVDGELISRPYIAITLNLLERFGVRVRRDGWQRFTVPGGARLRAEQTLHVEGDASSASYFIAAGALAARADAPLRVHGMGSGSIQGDLAFVDAARAMGAHVVLHERGLEVARGAWPLHAIARDCTEMPDAAMTLAVMALYAQGTTRLTGIGSWRVKETDRIAAMATELRRLGAPVREGADWIEVEPPPAWRAATVQTYDDHRMAMCLSLAAFNGLAGPGPEHPGVPVRILDPHCVAKTYPEYFETLFGLVQPQDHAVPVLTVDGPSASGKGTLASAVAQALGYHYLDSGAVYRATALAALRHGVSVQDEAALARLAGALALRFEADRTLLDGEDVSSALRSEDVGATASQLSAWPLVRAALRALQLSHRRVPGLVADGRDMGTVIFPDAALKIFLTASADTRADRRHKQLISKGISANIDALRAELQARDARDLGRSVAPLKPAQDAELLDNSELSVDASVARVLSAWERRRPF